MQGNRTLLPTLIPSSDFLACFKKCEIAKHFLNLREHELWYFLDQIFIIANFLLRLKILSFDFEPTIMYS